MGKIRVRTLGEEDIEAKQKKELKTKREQKKLAKVPGLKGGQRVVTVGPTEEELAKLSESDAAREISLDKKPATGETQKKQKRKKERTRSKSYKTVAKMLDRAKKYSLADALELLEKLKRSKFDETVEIHVNTIETGISGSTVLPHGTGKVFRVAIADDAILSEVQNGKINFDILLAAPDFMPKLARVAKFLGPRGLMPNPKNGTLTKDPEKLAQSFKKGQINFKTEAKTPIIHLSVGKISFGQKKLSENIEKVLEAIKKEKIQKAILKSTMSPGIKLEV
ncbi:50S ribosomal protein L1 [Candidatus Roizmanbacteria bacterium]|nr:50S ribosomal protein L1 [Candidatus Roizmanbacteria bacterium]